MKRGAGTLRLRVFALHSAPTKPCLKIRGSNKTAASVAILLGLALPMCAVAEEPAGAAVEATTVNGDRVLLHPNGRWEYVNPQKAAVARKVAEQFPENQGCAPGSQGSFFGFGRCIPPGDKDYNRGSLNPNRR